MPERKKRLLSIEIYDDVFGAGQGLEKVFEEAVQKKVEQLQRAHPTEEIDPIDVTSSMMWCTLCSELDDIFGADVVEEKEENYNRIAREAAQKTQDHPKTPDTPS